MSEVARRRQVLGLCLALGLGGLAYGLVCRYLGWGLPCLIYALTGLRCPGCGVSRMALCLMRLDFAGAWAANPVILCLLPLGAAVAAALARQYVKTGSRRLAGWPLAATWLMVAVLVGFGVIRNLPR